FTPDGRDIVSAGWDRIVRVWDAELGKERLQLLPSDGKQSMAGMTAVSPDGKSLASAIGFLMRGEDGTPTSLTVKVRLWDLRTGKVSYCFGVPGPHYSLNLAFSPDGKLLACSAGSTVHLWDVATGKELQRGIAGLGLTFSPDGSILATGVKGEEGAKG